MDCTHFTDAPDDPARVCRFRLEDLGHYCVNYYDYGYYEGQPCILLKLNRPQGWAPQLYTNDTLPAEARALMQNPDGSSRFREDHIGITCKGVVGA